MSRSRDQVVRYERAGEVVTITINVPERGNSLGRAVREGLFTAWARFENDEQARVAILTGAGERIFCSGADLSEMAAEQAKGPGDDWVPVLGENVIVTKPTIAAVNGFALGGGFLQMHMCDLVIASATASLGITEARWGRGAPWALPLFKAVAPRVLMELLLTAKPMSAARAHEVGLVNAVVAPEKLLEAAHELAEAVIANAPLSLAAAKKMHHIALTVTDSTAARKLTAEAYELVYESRDAQIGPLAFREGTKPLWTGT